jgi:hypothetical protein
MIFQSKAHFFMSGISKPVVQLNNPENVTPEEGD